jgi:hypothetical protein
MEMVIVGGNLVHLHILDVETMKGFISVNEQDYKMEVEHDQFNLVIGIQKKILEQGIVNVFIIFERILWMIL